MSKKQVIRINENQLKQIVTESVKRILKEGIGDEYLDNFGKETSRSKRFGNVKDLSSWSEEQFDGLNSTRKDMHKKGRGVKTKGSTETRDWLRKQTEKGNPIIKYKKNPDEWMKKHLDSVDELKIKKAIKESVKRVLRESVGNEEIKQEVDDILQQMGSGVVEWINDNYFEGTNGCFGHIFSTEKEAIYSLVNKMGDNHQYAIDYVDGAQTEEDWIQYLIKGGIPKQKAINIITSHNWDEVVNILVKYDGPEWFLSEYSGQVHQLSNGSLLYY